MGHSESITRAITEVRESATLSSGVTASHISEAGLNCYRANVLYGFAGEEVLSFDVVKFVCACIRVLWYAEFLKKSTSCDRRDYLFTNLYPTITL